MSRNDYQGGIQSGTGNRPEGFTVTFLKIDRYCQTNQPITRTQLEAQNKVSDKQT